MEEEHTPPTRRGFLKLAGATLGAAAGLAVLPEAARATLPRNSSRGPTTGSTPTSVQYTCCTDADLCRGGCPSHQSKFYCKTATSGCSNFCTACQPVNQDCYVVHFSGC